MKAHMLTVSGSDFVPCRLTIADIRIEDIAHALSLICRFGGHTKEHYSVAQHSLLVSRILASAGASPEIQLAGLMHDAHEAYIGDIPTPIKNALGSVWKALEAQAANTVLDAFCLNRVMRQHKSIIKQADLVALATERRDLTSFDTNRNLAWDILNGVSPFLEPASSGSWTPRWWAEQFLDRFTDLRDTAAILPTEAAA
ncbi:MAG: hypothetical protein B7X10_05885 [Burkholderiales bacterium 21-58-4]|nr:MAG: hypothetical protein B7X10_05885 [Burkholderiales bacterium 21-58-4]